MNSYLAVSKRYRKTGSVKFYFYLYFVLSGKTLIFNHNFSHSAAFFLILERTHILQCSPSVQVAVGHFRPGFQRFHRLCSDQLNKSTPPIEPPPLKVHTKPLTIQCFRLSGCFNICKAETVKASLQSFCK